MAKQPTSTPQNKPAGSRPLRPRTAPAGGVARAGEGVAGRARSVPSLTGFARDSWAELKKCTWPTRQETMNLTFAVIGMTLAIAAFLGLIDAILDQVIKALIG